MRAQVLADRITWFMRELKVPNGLKAVGYSSSDIDTLSKARCRSIA